MQASLAIVGCGAGLVAAWQRGAVELGIAALLLGSVVPFTLLVILPTHKRLLDPALGRNSGEATQLLKRWGWLDAKSAGYRLLTNLTINSLISRGRSC